MKKHLMRLFLLNYLLLLSICVVRAQERSDFYFTHVNGENGLSASNVKAILLWIYVVWDKKRTQPL